MAALARFVLRHRALVCLSWLLLLVGALPAAGAATDRLVLDFSLPGQPGYETEKQVLETYGGAMDFGTHLFTVTVPEGSTVDDRREDVDALFTTLQRELPQYRVAWEGKTGDDRFATRDERTAYGVVVDRPLQSFTDQPAFLVAEELVAGYEQRTGLDVETTGYFELSAGNTADGQQEAPSVLRETVLAGVMTLVVLLFVFASLMALVPLVAAAVSIMGTFLACSATPT